MKKILFYSLLLLPLSFTACQKEKEDLGIHSITTTVLVKQTEVSTTHAYGGEKASTTANITKTGALQISASGKDVFQEQLTLIVDKPKEGLVGTYTLRGKGHPEADASVMYFMMKESSSSVLANMFISRDDIIEGSLTIAGYDNASRQQTVNGSYRLVIKDVRDPTKIVGQTTDADNSDVTITGSFAGARLYKQP